MATSALINIYDENDNHLLGIHVQHDGGKILKTNLDRIIKSGRYVNSLAFNTPALGEAFLGMGCFAASLISTLKKECGSVFITKNTDSLNMYDYTYDIRFDNQNNKIVVY